MEQMVLNRAGCHLGHREVKVVVKRIPSAVLAGSEECLVKGKAVRPAGRAAARVLAVPVDLVDQAAEDLAGRVVPAVGLVDRRRES